jgi:outer membrane receptor protein involved in Fe transport
MFKKMLLLLLALSIPMLVLAQSSGKIIGVVKDKETGEPLPGVNVILQNTYIGGTTDVDGYFVILNVPVGAYSIEASYVGYTKMVVENVRVSADVTTEQNFDMQPTTLELGETVVVVAERPLVEKYVTHSSVNVGTETMQNAPIRGLTSFLEIMPSVVVQNGAINIRGGRGEEVGYYLDGASTMNPVNRTNAIHIIQEAVEEVQVLTGGFDAEYGDANSGIVKTQLRQGTPDFNLVLSAETDKFASEGKEFLGTTSFRDHIITATVSGPITNKIRYFIAGENESIGDSQKRFSTGFEFLDRVDMNPSQPRVAAGTPDTVNLVYPSGFTPNNWYDRYATNATLSFNFDPIRFRVSGVYNHTKSVGTNSPMRTLLQDRWQNSINQHALITGKLTHVLSSKTYYDVNLAYYYRGTHDIDDLFGDDNWKLWADSAAVYDKSNGKYVYRNAWQADYDYLINGITFTRPGGYGNYDESKQTYFGGGLDFVSQLTKNHELKFGVDGRMYTIRQYSINPYIMAHLDPNYVDASGNHLAGDYYATLEEIPYSRYRGYIGNTYGYDYLGNEIDTDNFDGPRKPIMGAAYLKDKIEYKDLIINAGLRLDYFDTDDYDLIHPDNPLVDQNTGTILESEWKKVDPMMFVSPRLGISFPVSETTKFYTQYGKYVQMPEFNDFYYNNYQYGRQIATGGYFYISPVGYGFDPIRTTSYELGFQKQLGDFASIDIAGFYKNVKGQILTTRVVPQAGSSITSYNVLANGDFSTNKGLEIKLTMRRHNRLQGQLNYTLTSAEGTGSGETAYISSVDRANGVLPTILSPLDFSQTHRGSMLLDYRFGKNDGGPILEQLGANLIIRFNSGHPYTKVLNVGGQSGAYDGGVDYMLDTRSRTAVEPINSSTTPWTSNVDLRLDKSFSIVDKVTATIYMRVTNLFNTKNVVNVYQETGSDTDDGYITDPDRWEPNAALYGGQDYVDLYKAINITNSESYLSQLGLQIYGQPRQIMFGIKLAY